MITNLTLPLVSFPKAITPLSSAGRSKVAKLHLKRLGVELEELNKEQADYIGVKVEGPYKPEYYRY